MDAAQWQRQLDVNLRAPALLTKAFAEALPDDREGCVINMLDNKIFSPNPDYFIFDRQVWFKRIDGNGRYVTGAAYPRLWYGRG